MKKRLLFTFLCLGLFAYGGSTAFAQGGMQIMGNIESAKVQISLDLQENEEGFERLSINNIGSPCYIRVVPNWDSNQDEMEDAILGIPDSFLKKKDGYYYSKIFESGEKIVFCTGVSIPEGIKEEELKVNFVVDALQSANITPNFAGESPWGSVEITEANPDRNYQVNVLKSAAPKGESLELLYNSEAEKLIPNFDEIFTNIPGLHPGDTYTETINLYNPSDEKKVLYISEMSDDSEILKYVDVTVATVFDGVSNTLYTGNLSANHEGELLAGDLEPKEKAQLMVKLHMLENAGNEASGLSGHVAIGMKAGNASDVDGEGNLVEEEVKEDTKIRSAKTGEADYIRLLCLVASVMLGCGLLILGRLKGDGHE